MAAPSASSFPEYDSLTTDVLIIGGGPTGMVAALCLDRLGVGSIVVERRESLHSHPKAHELSARSIEILAGLGIGHEELAAEASSFEDGSRILFCDTIGKEFGCVDLTSGGGADKYRRHLASPVPYLNLSQVALESILRGHLSRSRHARWMTGKQWESLSQGESLVESRIIDCRSGEPRTIRSRHVLCADGAASRSRAQLGIAMVGPDRLRDFMSASFEADLGPLVHTRGKLYFIFHPSVVGSVFIAHHIEKRWVFHTMVPTPYEKVEDYTEPVMRAKIHAALGRDDVEIRITSMSHWQMSAQVAARFRQGRAFLLGDAAHRFPPTGGLGMNSGIGDAHNLCWKLAAVLAGRAPDSLLDTYEAERRPVVQHNCDESRVNFERLSEIALAFGLDPRSIEKMSERLHSRPITSLPASGQRLVRRQVERYAASVLARYHKDPAVRDRVLSAIEGQRAHFDRIGLDLGYAYAAGALLCDGTPAPLGDHHVTDYLPSTRPGARFPHFWLDANRRRRSSHELIDYGRSTLVVGDAVRPSDEDGALTAAAARLGVKVTSLSCAGVPLAWRGEAHALMEIAADGAVLLRPDGHVAWRQASGVTLSAALVESLIVEAYR